jgi:hypothetical protein
MDIRLAILEEHSKAQCNTIVKYIGADEKKFAKLMQVFLGDDYRATQRAAWPLSYCVNNHPALVAPYFGKLVDLLEKPGAHNAVIRNITRLLQDLEVPAKYHGKVMNACFRFISDVHTPIAIKAFSLTILDNLSRTYPDIAQELKLIINERWNNESPAFKSRARKILERHARI